MRRVGQLAICASLILAISNNHGTAAEPEQPVDGAGENQFANLSAAEIFQRRILPLSESNAPSSCKECHFSGVEIRSYIGANQATTFASLRDEGLIDVENPDHSKILQFIRRQPENSDPLIAKVRQTELLAFRSWIVAAVREPELLATKATEGRLGIKLPAEVIRHARKDRVLSSFIENIWSEIGRCVHCHSPALNKKVVFEHGEEISWIRPHDPAGTLAHCVEEGLIDTEHPDESLILQKPLVLVDHVGGPKFAIGSRTDKNFRRFLRDFAAVTGGKYQRGDQLPRRSGEILVQTDQQMRVVDLPERFDGNLLRVNIYRWQRGKWSDTPWATADNPVNGKERIWQSQVFAIAPRESARAKEILQAKKMHLPAGRYLVKIYIDQQDKAKDDRDYELGEEDYFGQTEFHGRWPPGYLPPKIVHLPASP